MQNLTIVLKTALLTLIFGFLAGCGKEGGGAHGDAEPIPVFSADAKTVIVRVGKHEIRVGDFRDQFDYETGMYGFIWRQSRFYKPRDEKKRLGAFADRRLPMIVPQLVRNALVRQYLVEKCGSDDVERSESIVSNAVRELGAKAGNKQMRLEELAKEIGVRPDYMRDQFLSAAREKKALAVFDPDSQKVSDKEIEEGFARLDAYTARAVASNRVTWATCSNVLAKIRGGLSFEEAGRQYGESAEEAREWGFFGRDDIENAHLRKWAFSAKVGEIGGPFDIEDGLSIVKVLKHEAGTGSESMASRKVEDVTLARVNFPMVEEHPEPRTREFCRKAILDRKRQDTQNRLLGKLYDETKLEYPNGDKLDFRRNEDEQSK